MTKVIISVHELVDFVLRSGDIDTRVFNLETMNRGTQIHSYYQAKQNDKYLAEQSLKYEFTFDDNLITLHGRVDGIVINNEKVVIEEIKSTNSELESFFSMNEKWHLGQAECYALIYALNNNLATIHVQLTYISQVDERKIIKLYEYDLATLKANINHYFSQYFTFFNTIEKYRKMRKKGAFPLKFPFEFVRSGQVEMMSSIKESLTRKESLFINAPTGIGKTMAALFPSIEYLHNHGPLKIFYLTAKGSGKLQAEEAISIIAKSYKIKSITLNAKEKMCLNDQIACNPEQCPFARNYYGKLKNALLDIYTNFDEFSSDLITSIATKHELCPFEFQLDLSLYCDVIIADYNYLFDPFVYLRRFFEIKSEEYVVLVDEAHNLPRRVSDNYSKILDFSPFYSFRKTLRGPEHKSVRTHINRIVKYLEEYKKSIGFDLEAINIFPLELQDLLTRFMPVASEYMQEQGSEILETFSDFYFEVNKFLKILAFVNDDFVIYTEIDSDRKFFPKFYIKCLNGVNFIKEKLNFVDHSLLFSATLAPETYFKTMFAIEGKIHNIDSPFLAEQLLILVDKSVSLYYKDRDRTLSEVAEKIIAAISVKQGNYMVYAPSFEYLRLLEQKIRDANFQNLVVQDQNMNDFLKSQFLNSFKPNPQTTQLGLAVLGGSFSEGVDLVSDRLSGVIILGVGYPPPSFEKELEKDYFEDKFNEGINFTYVYPALNKILQTMGRVIRSEKDRGFVLLIDKRYNYEPYRKTLQNYNGEIKGVKSADVIIQELTSFFWN